MTHYQQLLELIHHGNSPYSGFPADQWAGNWYNDPGAKRETFAKAVNMANPGLIVEVGSFVGESAIHMAKNCLPPGRDAAILCIDTWMGGIDHWKSVPEKLKFHFGRPSLYYQFIGNVIKSGCQDTILPLSLDSINGARLLELLDLHPSLVYVDASHEEGDVLRDYEAYWKAIRSGGVMLVDDLTGWFPGVVADFRRFCEMKDLTPAIEGEKGIVVKP